MIPRYALGEQEWAPGSPKGLPSCSEPIHLDPARGFLKKFGKIIAAPTNLFLKSAGETIKKLGVTGVGVGPVSLGFGGGTDQGVQNIVDSRNFGRTIGQLFEDFKSNFLTNVGRKVAETDIGKRIIDEQRRKALRNFFVSPIFIGAVIVVAFLTFLAFRKS